MEDVYHRRGEQTAYTAPTAESSNAGGCNGDWTMSVMRATIMDGEIHGDLMMAIAHARSLVTMA